MELLGLPEKTAFLIIALVFVVNEGRGVTAEDETISTADQVAQETKNRALTIIDGPKYVPKLEPTQPATKPSTSPKPEQRPPSKPPIFPDKPGPHKYYVDIQRPYYGSMYKAPPRPYSQPLKFFNSPNSVYNYPKLSHTMPLPHHKTQYYTKPLPRPIIYNTPSQSNKSVTTKGQKYSQPIQTINGIRKEHVKPPKEAIRPVTTTTAFPTTTTRYLRTKRIWPKKVLEKINATLYNSNRTTYNTSLTNSTDTTDYDPSASITRIRYVFRNATTYSGPSTRRPYRPVTRIPRARSTTPFFNETEPKDNDWVPIVPNHYTGIRRPIHSRVRRSAYDPEALQPNKGPLYLHSFGLIPMQNLSKLTAATDEPF
ncbi:hypothetical protein ACJJTC_010909 [Scirpophaga incertulas]